MTAESHPVPVSTQDLLAIIGEQHVEIRALRARLAQLETTTDRQAPR